MGWIRSVSDFVGSKKSIRARPFLSIKKTQFFSSDQPVTRPTTTQQSNSFSDSDRFGNFYLPLITTRILKKVIEETPSKKVSQQ
jgi:hypothetical protein